MGKKGVAIKRRFEYSLVALPTQAGPAPCDDCSHYENCHKSKIACQDYQKYLNKQKWESKEKTQRLPTKIKYYHIFGAGG